MYYRPTETPSIVYGVCIAWCLKIDKTLMIRWDDFEQKNAKNNLRN